MIETATVSLVATGSTGTYHPRSTATPVPGHTNVLSDIARAGGMNGVFPANPTADDLWRWLICEVVMCVLVRCGWGVVRFIWRI